MSRWKQGSDNHKLGEWSPLELELREGIEWSLGGGMREAFWRDNNILFLGLDGGYIGIHTVSRLLS